MDSQYGQDMINSNDGPRTLVPDEAQFTVVLAANNTYAVPLLVTILSLVENAKDTTCYQIHALISSDFDSIYAEAANAILVNFGMPPAVFHNMGNEYGNVRLHISHTSVQTFYRLRIPSLLDCDRCLYLDVDTIVLRDLSDLLTMDMGDAYIAGVRAAGYYWPPERRQLHVERLGISAFDQYVNAGVLLMNIAAMREDDIEDEFAKLLGRDFESQDQDILNVACYGRIRLLPPRYNSMTKYGNVDPSGYDGEFGSALRECYGRIDWEEACLRPAIVHYADRIKPWDSMAVPHVEEWWRYALALGAWLPFKEHVIHGLIRPSIAERYRRVSLDALMSEMIGQVNRS